MDDSRCARRVALESVKFSNYTHARLWLDRYLTLQTRDDADKDEKKEAKDAAIELIQVLETKALVPEGYESALNRRIQHLRDDPTRVTVIVVYRCVGRLAAGLGEAGVLENGLAIQHTWGLPYLPGPSLKGVAAAAAHKLVEETTWSKTGGEDGAKGEAATLLFGDVDWRGSVEFLDGWFVPDEFKKAPYHLDIMTPHNSSYYQGKSAHATPTGQDSPVPVSFLSASGHYAVALSASHEAAEAGWLDAAKDLLDMGLEQLGIGAKTNAGYGRLVPDSKRLEALDDAVSKHNEFLQLASARLSELLARGLDEDLKRKKSAARLCDQLRKLAGGSLGDMKVSEFFGSKKICAVLTEHPDNDHLSARHVHDALQDVLKRNATIQSWAAGQQGNVEIGRSRGQLEKAASWANVTPNSPSPNDTAAPAPKSPLLEMFAEASQLTDVAQALLSRAFDQNNELDAQLLDALEQEVDQLDDDGATTIWLDMLDRVNE